LHPAETLELSQEFVDPETAWKRLTRGARRELKDRADNQRLERVAGQADGGNRFWAAVLAYNGLHIATPGSDERTWTYSSWRFKPGSLTTVTHAITEDAPEPADAAQEDSADPSDTGEALLTQSLNADFRAFLGHLPTPVQVSFQQPFHPGPDFTMFRWFQGDIELTDKTWRFWAYLTDGATMVFASGSRQPAASPGAAMTWTAHCHQAAIA
jgi:hypothetical protein